MNSLFCQTLVNDFEKAKKLGQLARAHVSNLYDNDKIMDNLVKFCSIQYEASYPYISVSIPHK